MNFLWSSYGFSEPQGNFRLTHLLCARSQRLAAPFAAGERVLQAGGKRFVHGIGLDVELLRPAACHLRVQLHAAP